MVNLILLQAKESCTNDFVSVPNKKKVALLFCLCFKKLKLLLMQKVSGIFLVMSLRNTNYSHM